MKKKGFTLIELLGVITVLAMILLVAVPNITRTLQRNSEKEYNQFIEELELATETYLQNHKSDYPELSKIGGAISIQMEKLIDYGVIDSTLINPETKEKIQKKDIMVVRKNEDGILKYEFLVSNRKDLKVIGIKDPIRIEEGEAYDFLEGVTAFDTENNILSNLTVSIEDSSTLTMGIYDLIYEARKEQLVFSQKVKLIVEKTYTFSLISASKEFKAPVNGVYQIELWGAQGGTIGSYAGGKGSYTSGTISLKENDSLFVFVGGSPAASVEAGGYNGGGTLTSGQKIYGAAGGGATDVRLNNNGVADFESLKSRIMVAAGGGGANNRSSNYGDGVGGAGGTLVGINGESVNHTNGYGYGIGRGGSQTAGGQFVWTPGTTAQATAPNGVFGQGGGINSGTALTQSGGGSGYYGGSASAHGGAGGGSSFISGHSGCDAISKNSTSTNIIHTGQPNHYSGLVFKNMVMKAGNEEMPTHDGTDKMTGNTGNGYAKIKYIGE